MHLSQNIQVPESYRVSTSKLLIHIVLIAIIETLTSNKL
jgi:hypothetical protein